MMTTYAEILRRAWPVFLEATRMRRTISYSELAGRIGPPCTARAIHRQLLNPLSARCRLWDLPDLPALVVRKGSGTPGAGWFDPAASGDPIERWAEAVALCYQYRWPKLPDPRLSAGSEEQE
ncbi:hypothetical protein P12x_001279 [Tundrisphaera lichenicola]|uniref:hypothetical protein n=1 Tax=Tundrisphaera lichenicola TaxID=2029860 RepID=UPI003EBA0E8D